MTACCLEGANLCEAMLDAAQLPPWSSESALHCRSGCILRLGQANAVDANFADASLNGALGSIASSEPDTWAAGRSRGVSMRTSNLSRATFQHASLQRAVLANCRLEGSNFEDAGINLRLEASEAVAWDCSPM